MRNIQKVFYVRRSDRYKDKQHYHDVIVPNLKVLITPVSTNMVMVQEYLYSSDWQDSFKTAYRDKDGKITNGKLVVLPNVEVNEFFDALITYEGYEEVTDVEDPADSSKAAVKRMEF